MSILNQNNCQTPTANTGQGDCAFDLKAISGGFLVPRDFIIPAASLVDADTALAYLRAAAEADDYNERILPLPETFNFTDNSEDTVYQTGSTGVNIPVREGNIDWTFQFIAGGLCLLKELQKLNASNRKYMFIDAQGALVGTRVGDDLAGIPLNFFKAEKWKANDSANVTQYMYRVNFHPSYVNESIGFIKLNYADVASISGLLNIGLTQLAPRVAAVMQIGATLSCGGQDLYEQYADELASVTAWGAKIAGKVVTITSVVKNDNLSGWTVTLDSTDPDYAATGNVVVSLAAPSVLDGLGVSGYSGIPKVIKTT